MRTMIKCFISVIGSNSIMSFMSWSAVFVKVVTFQWSCICCPRGSMESMWEDMHAGSVPMREVSYTPGIDIGENYVYPLDGPSTGGCRGEQFALFHAIACGKQETCFMLLVLLMSGILSCKHCTPTTRPICIRCQNHKGYSEKIQELQHSRR